MKLMRVGPIGDEVPAVLSDGGEILDVSDFITEFDQAFFASDGLNMLARVLENDLPMIEPSVRIGAPIAKPYQVLCIGMNYRDHAKEVGAEIPVEPTVFNKGPHTVVGPNDDVLIPPGSSATDWEVELSIIIGSEARYLADEAEAEECIAGFAISNDVSERHYQLERGGQWVKGKSCETFNPLGPWLVTRDSIADPGDLRMELTVNGRLKQNSSTSEMVFGVNFLVWYLSQFMVLEPGDLINTGTPAGVALGDIDPQYLRDGDVIEVAIPGLGAQRQMVRQSTR
jgi:2-keto-4-pentenoate hydratase/2-oxohepta-3-ene-1,7-dioic acid hydratase in catechol pathway